jgi:putative phosphoesterase
VSRKTYFQRRLSIHQVKLRKNGIPYNRAAKINAITLKRIGLISDTHGFLDDAVFRHFEKCDEIWHAGDFGDRSLSDRLADFRPLTGVFGNIDGYDIRSIHPEFRCWSCEDLKVLMIHIGGYPGRYAPKARILLHEHRPGLFITGHSHILKVMHDPRLGCLHMNPGAAGKQGWHKVRTLIRFTVEGSDIRDCEVVEMAR